MPPDNIDVDFARLAIQDADFGKVYDSVKGRVDFQDPMAVQQLTKSLLKRDFGLHIDLPDDRLCPPVPIRYEYIRWIQDLLDTTSDEFTDEYDPERPVIGLDIGVGASCIYPLLGCASRPKWRFGGTEIDDRNLQYASRNVNLNKLSSRVRLSKPPPGDSILCLDVLGIKRADFIMCNPPFFTSKVDMLATFEKKRPPSAVCTGADVEMITQGGDLGFVLRMFEESKKLQARVQWFTSMLGKLQSVNSLVTKLKADGISNWAVTCLKSGHITRRWAVAWSFEDFRPRNDVARSDSTIKDFLPFPTAMCIPLPEMDAQISSICINEELRNLPVKWNWDDATQSGLCLAAENVWSRSARRRRDREGITEKRDAEDDEDEEEEEVALAVRISIPQTEEEVIIRWLQGHDSVLFESFCGMLKRALSKLNSSRS